MANIFFLFILFQKMILLFQEDLYFNKHKEKSLNKGEVGIVSQTENWKGKSFMIPMVIVIYHKAHQQL